MNLGTQYYRAPFPNEKHWDDDLRRMKDAGLNCVQLWVLWAWVESTPGVFCFDDYDRLVDLADKHGLGVVLSTIAEIHPLWIHREIPGSELVTHEGHRVISTARCGVHFGLTPGGCFDHPEVWKRMTGFLEATARQYRGASHLRGWDAWNELRWNVHAVDRVCYCEHTLLAFRAWLDRTHGSLAGLNRAWQRRYGAWDEVRPGKYPGLPFTENMAFCHFLTWRSCEHGRMRYEVLKAVDPDRPVTLHGGAPSGEYAGSEQDQALNRGNDWFFADHLDGVGTSSFPKWGGIDDADFGMRIEFVKSAARGKHVWLSELQGGRAATGFKMFDSVDALSQQRWIWNGVACGADTILFWCWRDEVFTTESAGFGLIGLDGLAEERLAAMRVTGKAFAEHADLLGSYQPARAEVGVLFSPQSYYHHWSTEYRADRCRNALRGYARALIRRSIPYVVVEEEHLEALEGLKVLFLPRITATSPALEAALEAFVKAGGTLVCESETGAFSPEGIYRYPEERFPARLAGAEEVGRRRVTGKSIAASVAGKTLRLDVSDQWFTPWRVQGSRICAKHKDGALLTCVPVGKGRLILIGAYLGEAYYAKKSGPLEELVEHVVRSADWTPEVEILAPKPTAKAFLYVKTGLSQGRRLVFVFFQEGQKTARLRFASGFLQGKTFTDLITGKRYPLAAGKKVPELSLAAPKRRFAVLAEEVL